MYGPLYVCVPWFQVQLQDLKHVGLLRGTLDIEQQFALISATNDFKQCVAGAMYVQVIKTGTDAGLLFQRVVQPGKRGGGGSLAWDQR